MHDVDVYAPTKNLACILECAMNTRSGVALIFSHHGPSFLEFAALHGSTMPSLGLGFRFRATVLTTGNATQHPNLTAGFRKQKSRPLEWRNAKHFPGLIVLLLLFQPHHN